MSTSSDRGLFVWHEVGSHDLRASEAFYSSLIGWKAEGWDQNPSYRLFKARHEAKAGLYVITAELNKVPPPPHWLSYIGTPDVDATVRQAVELGGKVIVPAYNVPNVGRMAHLQDPQGAFFAVSAQDERTTYEEPQIGDFSWHELLTTNPQTAWDFYSKLFGWEKTEAMDMGARGTYQVFGTDGHALGGIFAAGGLPGGPLWIPYVRLRDAKRAAETARELGAAIAHGPAEVPGGDWVFTGIDGQGAMFAVQSRNTKIAKDTKTTKDTKNTKGTKDTKGTKSAKSGSTKIRKVAKATKGKKKKNTKTR